MGDDLVSLRECEMQHEALTARLDSIDHNFSKVFEKLDILASMSGKVEFINQKIEILGKRQEQHEKEHTGFISITLGIIAIASTLIAVIMRMIK